MAEAEPELGLLREAVEDRPIGRDGFFVAACPYEEQGFKNTVRLVFRFGCLQSRDLGFCLIKRL